MSSGAAGDRRLEGVGAARSGSRLSDDDVFWFNEGTHRRLGEKLGAHLLVPGTAGTSFAVWAPNAAGVSVIGDFNGWDPRRDPLVPRGGSGIWEGVVAEAGAGDVYKFSVTGTDGTRADKADPVAFRSEVPPRTGSVVWDLHYDWGDGEWMRDRGDRARLSSPMSIYEVHLGSWLRDRTDPGRLLGYAEVAPRLVEHVKRTGFTHVEFLPVMEHPFYGSWGYQVTGFFAPTSRYGSPQELMALIDELHQVGDRGDPRLGALALRHRRVRRSPGSTGPISTSMPTLGSGCTRTGGASIFNYGRHEVRSFLASSRRALAVEVPRRRAARGRRGLDALPRLFPRSRRVGSQRVRGPREPRGRRASSGSSTTGIYADHPDVQTIAEESTAWPGVIAPDRDGGPGVRAQVGHGVDARLAGLLRARPRPPALPLRRADLPRRCTRSPRTSCFPSPTTRWCTASARCVDEDAGGRLAAVRQPSPALRVPVRPAGQEAAVHGIRDRPMEGVGPRAGPRLGAARPASPRRDVPVGGGPATVCTGSNRRSTSSTSIRAGSSGC